MWLSLLEDKMDEALALFKETYIQTQSIEICIAELKRKGFNRNDTIKVLMMVSKINVIDADKRVMNSLAWS